MEKGVRGKKGWGGSYPNHACTEKEGEGNGSDGRRLS